MLGTGTRDLPTYTTGGALHDLLEELPGADRESLVLARLSAIALIKKASLPLAKLSQPLPEPCPPETRKPAPVAAISIFNQLIDDLTANGMRLLERWLTLAATNGYLIPDYLLPVVLDKLKNKKAPVTLINLCGGNRLVFLVKANTEWKGFDLMAQNGSDLVEKIDAGTKEERLASFLQLRQSDPALAIKSIQDDFNKEPADLRVAFLKRIEIPHKDDRQFLEGLVKADKSKEVREIANDLLSLLPQSSTSSMLHQQLKEVMQAGAEIQIKLEDGEDFDKRYNLLSDLSLGYATTSQDLGSGVKAGYLRRLIARINPDYLVEYFQKSPREIVSQFEQSEQWGFALTSGLMESVSYFGARGLCQTVSDWQIALVQSAGDKLTEFQSGLRLFQSLPAALLEEILLEKLPRWSNQGATVAPKLDFWYQLDKVQFDWSETFTQKVLDFIIKEAKEKVPALDYTFRTSVTNFAMDMHLSAARRIDELAAIQRDGEQSDFFARPLYQLVEILSLRRDIEAAFNGENGVNDERAR